METNIESGRRPRRSAADIKNLIAEFKTSKQTIAAFCSARSIQTSTFHKWVSRAKGKDTKVAGFATVRVSTSNVTGLFAEVHGIKIFQPVSAEFLKQLL